MSRIESRIRKLINPYSTAFTAWWCHAGRRTRLGRSIEAAGSRRHGHAAPSLPGGAPEASRLHRQTTSMAARRAAIDAILANRGDDGQGSPA
jgi:hypothetical protein